MQVMATSPGCSPVVAALRVIDVDSWTSFRQPDSAPTAASAINTSDEQSKQRVDKVFIAPPLKVWIFASPARDSKSGPADSGEKNRRKIAIVLWRGAVACWYEIRFARRHEPARRD
jgi:hypothetical protein